jgi:hypothetical protein
MKLKLVSLLMLVVILNTWSALGSQPALSLTPVADGDVYAYSYRNWDWANWGMSETMSAGWNPTGGERRAYLKFDVPADLGVNRAVLKLYQYYNFGPVHTLGVYRVTGPWDEGTDTYHSGEVEETAASGELCWMQQPSFDPVSVATFNSATAVPAWVEVDITSLVQQWQAGTPNYGLVIKTKSDFEATSGFFTKERPTEPEEKVSVKQSVCASAKPSYTEGSKFENGYFTIEGTQPQKVTITSQAENFDIVGGDGVSVYQRSDGKSSGSLTLAPGTYILSCYGGGAMGTMSATVCIEYPVVEVTPKQAKGPVLELYKTIKQSVCASANPSYTEGGEFKRANFTIGGTAPQKVTITTQADNFDIVRGDGVRVYQRSDGKSSGSLTLMPGTYILSCYGGGAMGTMSATVCIEYPVVEVMSTEPEMEFGDPETVCASANPSYTEGGEFKRANFTIGGTAPQKVTITTQADNFDIVRGDGVRVYQRSDGKSSGSLTLAPGTYTLSCYGGGAMGTMSATVCIQYHPVVEVTPEQA